MDRTVSLRCGGKAVELNDFSARVLRGTLLGLVGALRGVDTRQEITVVIDPSGRSNAMKRAITVLLLACVIVLRHRPTERACGLPPPRARRTAGCCPC